MAHTYETLRIHSDREGLVRIVLFRPDRLNAMTRTMVRELDAALRAVEADAGIRVLVLTGEGDRGFCPGLDLGHDGSQEESLQPEHFQVVTMLHEMATVTVAAINGACAGAGLGWALACDFRVITTRAKLNTAFLDVGVAGDMGVPWFLSRLVGSSKARDISMLQPKFDAETALRLGLVDRVFPDQSFRDDTDLFVDTLMSKPPRALRLLKANYAAAESMPLADYVQLEAERHQALLREVGPPVPTPLIPLPARS